MTIITRNNLTCDETLNVEQSKSSQKPFTSKDQEVDAPPVPPDSPAVKSWKRGTVRQKQWSPSAHHHGEGA
eukprot:5744781-Pyramimonas_sp.AAC.1